MTSKSLLFGLTRLNQSVL